jgi:hypothetical protein
MSKRHLLSHVKETTPEQASRVSQRARELVTLNPKHARSKRVCVSQQAHSFCRIGRSARIRQKARGPQKQHGRERRWGPSTADSPRPLIVLQLEDQQFGAIQVHMCERHGHAAQPGTSGWGGARGSWTAARSDRSRGDAELGEEHGLRALVSKHTPLARV